MQLVLIAHNIRSCHNVGSLLRTAEGLGIEAVWLTGYTPYPQIENDERMPHISSKISKQINKTALGAENYVSWFHRQDIYSLINELKSYEYVVAALEQTKGSVRLESYKAPDRIALIVGREVEGLEQKIIDACDVTLEITMAGKKESYNVAIASAMAMHHLLFAK